MPTGTHRHCKRLAAPVSWGLEKTGGTFAIRMQSGAHTRLLALPLRYILTRHLKVAHSTREASYILKNKMVLVNGKDVFRPKMPVGLFDVITLKQSNSHYRVLFNVNRKFILHKITAEESQFRLTKVLAKYTHEEIPYTRTMDGSNFRFVDPAVTIGATVKVNIKEGKVTEWMNMEPNKVAMIYGGSNTGRIGVISRLERLKNGKTFLYLTDAVGKVFTVPSDKAICIGDKDELWLSLFENAGIKLDEYEQSNIRYATEKEVAVEDN